MFEIREASVDDIDEINRISAYLGYRSSSIEEAKKRLSKIILSNSDFIWVYSEDEKVKGWLHLFLAIRLASPKFAEIGGLVVDRSSQRLGIGGKLVQQAMQWSKSNNLPLKVRCNSIREDANMFYESLGFKNEKAQNVHIVQNSWSKH